MEAGLEESVVVVVGVESDAEWKRLDELKQQAGWWRVEKLIFRCGSMFSLKLEGTHRNILNILNSFVVFPKGTNLFKLFLSHTQPNFPAKTFRRRAFTNRPLSTARPPAASYRTPVRQPSPSSPAFALY